MSETSVNTPTSVPMRGRVGSPRARGGSDTGGWGTPGASALTHGDVREAVNAANRDEAEKTYGEDSVRVLRVVLPGAPRFDSSGVSHGDSGCVSAGGGGYDSHGCHGVVGVRAPQPAGDAGGITDGVSCGMPVRGVERDAATVVPAPTIGALAGDADTHSGGRCDSGGAGTDENMCGRAGCGVYCCDGGEGSAFIDAAPSPQRPMRSIPNTGVSLFDMPVVLERRYVTTPPNGDKGTPGFSSAGAATGVGEGVDEEAGVPLSVSVKPRKDVSISTTRGDSCGDTTGGAELSSGGDNDYCRVSDGGKYGDCRG